ncbi:MAG: hypothetical protein ACLQT5_00190 [Steroidobacteraceae bacterium]
MNLRHTLEIAPDHPAFDGHFPGTPILPGAVLLDEALRFIEVDLALDLTQWQIANAKFLERVRPGDSLTVEHSGPANGMVRFTIRIAHPAGAAKPALSGTLLAVRNPGASDA